MKLIVSFALIFATVAIVSLEAQRIVYPIRRVTPHPGIDYKIRQVPLRRLNQNTMRVARSIDDQDQDQILESDSEIEAHSIEKRAAGERRVVINYKPPPPNGPRHARDIEEEAEIMEYEPEIDHVVQKRESGRVIFINKPAPPKRYRYGRDVEEENEIEEYEPEFEHVEKREPSDEISRIDRDIQDTSISEGAELAEEFGPEPTVQ